MRKILALLLVGMWIFMSAGCATQQQQQSAAAGGAIGAVAGGLLGYMIGGKEGAVIGALSGAAIGALSGWAYAKRQEAIKEAAKQNQKIVIVKEDKTEKVIAEPIGIEKKDGKTYRKVRARTYKVDPKTNKEELTSDTIEMVPLD